MQAVQARTGQFIKARQFTVHCNFAPLYLKRGRGGHILNSEAERAETYLLKICHHANTLHMI